MEKNGTKADINWIKQTLIEVSDDIREIKQEMYHINNRVLTLETLRTSNENHKLLNIRFIDLMLGIGMFAIAYISYIN